MLQFNLKPKQREGFTEGKRRAVKRETKTQRNERKKIAKEDGFE